uniref:Protein kinase domain-containing protein n=1 Tax=viral metagenome TaxID=1070528 RepID=A0A6C0H5U4_9ZZZZ
MNFLSFKKRNNDKLFDDLKKKIELYETQNYLPIYNDYFNYVKTPESGLNLNNRKIVYSIKKKIKENVVRGVIVDTKTGNKKNKDVYIKISGIRDPYRYLMGKLKKEGEKIFDLPKMNDKNKSNNSTYVDGLFYYITSKLLELYGFVHGIEYYGSFIGIKNNYLLDITDDLDILEMYPFFKSNNGILYTSNRKLLDYKTLPDIKIGDVIEDEENIKWNDEDFEASLSSLSDSIDSEEEDIMITIKKFPVNIILLEKCNETLDYLIFNENITDEMWFSYLMQIIMILIVYQDKFNMTHNDLHTCNIMFINTKKKYLNYKYDGKYYRVKTFGKIFKVIDFGRSIYNFGYKRIISHCFEKNEDADGQYNFEKIGNKNKPIVEANKSFDLCRLGCSLFEELIDNKKGKMISKITSPFLRLVIEWCKDDNGVNIYYKNNGNERYPDFKLYKMIAKKVHNHTPHNQLMRDEFKKFEYNKKMKKVIDIDNIPKFYE